MDNLIQQKVFAHVAYIILLPQKYYVADYNQWGDVSRSGSEVQMLGETPRPSYLRINP